MNKKTLEKLSSNLKNILSKKDENNISDFLNSLSLLIFEKKYDDIKSITEKANLNLNSYFRFTNDPSLLNPSIYFFNPLIDNNLDILPLDFESFSSGFDNKFDVIEYIENFLSNKNLNSEFFNYIYNYFKIYYNEFGLSLSDFNDYELAYENFKENISTNEKLELYIDEIIDNLGCDYVHLTYNCSSTNLILSQLNRSILTRPRLTSHFVILNYIETHFNDFFKILESEKTSSNLLNYNSLFANIVFKDSFVFFNK